MKRKMLYIIAISFLPLSIWAATTGKVMGLVTKKGSGEPISHVEITIQGTTQKTTTDAEGRFTLMAVPPGMYTLTARASNYNTYEQPIQVTSDYVVTANLQLQQASFSFVGLKFWSFAWIPTIAIILTTIWYFVVVKPRRENTES